MKTLYSLIATIFFLFSVLFSEGQIYTAIHSGNWSNTLTWDANGVPPSNCKTCTVTIDAGVKVTLDISVVNLTNTSQLIIGSSSVGATAALILNGNTLNVKTGSIITIANSFSYIDGTAAGSSMSYFNGSGMVGPLLDPTSNYNFNCGGSTGNSCALGVVYGSAYSTTGNSAKNVTFISGGLILPVELTNFIALINDNQYVSLSWETQQEVNSSYFSIERSEDGNNWKAVGSVSAADNSASIRYYSFIDQSSIDGIAYYRLKMVDLNGQYAYSDIKVVRNAVVKSISIFPNPATDFVNISLNESSTTLVARLINLNGQILAQQEMSGSTATTITLSLHNYPQGVYFLQISNSKGTVAQTTKLIITH
jgi:hypothetical protein